MSIGVKNSGFSVTSMKKTSTNVDMTGFIEVTEKVTESEKVTLINVT